MHLFFLLTKIDKYVKMDLQIKKEMIFCGE